MCNIYYNSFQSFKIKLKLVGTNGSLFFNNLTGMQSINLETTAKYLYKEMARATAEAQKRERMKKTVEAEGRRLLEVRAAESAGFWYTANTEGFDAPGICCCPPPRSITDLCQLACLGFNNVNFRHCWGFWSWMRKPEFSKFQRLLISVL